MQQHSPQHTPATQRENFLMALLNKLIKEYKDLLDYTRQVKSFKIVDIIQLSPVPGETLFAVQITNKNCVLRLSAAEIVEKKFHLSDFPSFHAEMIRQAAQGKLESFLQLQDAKCKILSKKYDRNTRQYVFTVEPAGQQSIKYTAQELSNNKNLLKDMNVDDVYDIAYTHGSESIIKEEAFFQATHK